MFKLPPNLENLYDKTVELLSRTDLGAGGLTYNRYRAISFLKANKKLRYQNADRISQQLAVIMRTLLVKRIDSSFHAFRLSLGRFRDATRVMLDMFKKGTVYIAPNLNVTEFLLEDREEELLAKIAERQSTDPTIEICQPDDFEDGFLDGLKSDFKRLDELCVEWNKYEDIDPKLDEFLRRLETELFSRRINHEGRKLIVFSESKETTDHLVEHLKKAGYDRVLAVHSGNRKEMMPLANANFDANRKDQAHDYEILVSTEVLAEGVNLHRANVIVNYDTPWNSTRLMQRIGRVNRIGGTAPRIYVFNFYPTTQVDNDIELKKKAIMKLQAFHSALGEDSQIYSETEEVDTFGLFERAPEDEERDERLALLMELRKFRQLHPEEFRRIHNLPLRSRVGRADASRAGTTVTFIRSPRRDGFYRFAPDQDMEEISVVEAAREFRAPDPHEQCIPLHAAHYDHINTAIGAFHESVVEEALADQAISTIQGPNERRALAFLDGFLGLAFVSDPERRLIHAAKHAIQRARFQQLQRQINQLQKSTKDVKVAPIALLEKLLPILNSYPLTTATEESAAPQIAHTDETVPDIILSESFDKAPTK